MTDVSALTDEDFETTIQGSDVTVLVDFSATWCGPCKALAPTIENVAKEYSGKLAVYTVDVDDNPKSPGHFGVTGVPTCIFFKGGREVDRFTGVQDVRSVKQLVDKHVD